MSLIEHSKLELQMAGLFDVDSDYDGAIGQSVMELIEVLAEQGHSGMSAPYVVDIFSKLASFKPLLPITGKDEEWGDVRDLGDGNSWYQNKRCSALFKDGKDGKPYYIDAIIKRDQNGICWSGMAWLSEEDYKSGDRTKMVGKKAYVKSFPFVPKTFYIDTQDVEVEKDDWESFVVDSSQLNEIWDYYDQN